MRLLLVSLLAAGSVFAGDSAASEQSVQQLNVPVRDVTQACKLYSALGFEANKDCETCEFVVLTHDGIRMTLWPDVEGAGVQPRHLDIVAPVLPATERLSELDASVAPSSDRAGCWMVTDADGYQVDVCPPPQTS